MATGPSHRHTLPCLSARVNGRRASGKDARLPEPRAVSATLPHPDHGQGAGSLPLQLRQPLRYATTAAPEALGSGESIAWGRAW